MTYYKESDELCCHLTLACPNPKFPTTVVHTLNELEIEKTAIFLTRKLANGIDVQVWEGTWNSSTPVAVKKAKLGTIAADNLLLEAQILKEIQDKNIIKLYGICSKTDPAYLIIEFMTKGNLLDYMKTDEGLSMTHKEVINIASQVASGMYYLELHHYIHRDLCAKNVLVGDQSIKITNFGKAKVLKKDAYEYRLPEYEHLPNRWTAPEVFSTLRYSIKADVWSFGILLMELVTHGQQPYLRMAEDEVPEKVTSGYRMPCPSICPSYLYQTMMNCWKIIPFERPTFEYLHYLNDYVSEADHVYHHDVSSLI